MTEQEVVEAIRGVLMYGEDGYALPGDLNMRTFEEAGVMSMNAGLVFEVDGHEYQMTLVRSR